MATPIRTRTWKGRVGTIELKIPTIHGQKLLPLAA
jgi:hypothetical protein